MNHFNFRTGLLSLLILAFQISFAQQSNIFFHNLTPSMGLSDGTVQNFALDQQGRMWLCTWEGLDMYDGYKFTVYRNNPKNPKSIHDNRAFCCSLAKDGKLWIGTGDGISIFDPKSETFTKFNDILAVRNHKVMSDVRTIFFETENTIWVGTSTGLYKINRLNYTTTLFNAKPEDKDGLSSPRITWVYKDKRGNFWVATETGGLNLFNPITNKFKRYIHDPLNKSSITDNNVTRIAEDSRGNLWIATYGGWDQFDYNTETFKHFTYDPNKKFGPLQGGGGDFLEDKNHNIWISFQSGLALYNYDTDQFIPIKSEACNPHSLVGSEIWRIYQDPNGNIWFGSHTNGISMYDSKSAQFTSYQYNPQNANSLSGNSILCLHEDSIGNLWIGIDHGGLDYFDRKTKTFTHYKNNPNDPNSLSSDAVLSIEIDHNGIVWAGTWGGGLNMFNPKTKKFKVFKPSSAKGSISSLNIWEVFEDSNKNLWVGTHEAGLNLYDPVTNQFKTFRSNPNNRKGLTNDLVWCVKEDRMKNLWVGTACGLNRYNPKDQTFEQYCIQYKGNDILKGTCIQDFVDTPDGLFLCTLTDFEILDQKTKKIRIFKEADGLVDNDVMSIVEDNHHMFWLGTNAGISKLNPKTMKFKNYNSKNGLVSIAFNRKSALKLNDGSLVFGGSQGLNIFQPDSVRGNTVAPPIVFTDFSIYNEKIPIAGEGSPLKNHINFTDHIVLNHKQEVFTIYFAALNFIFPEQNQYAYKLEGFDERWNYIGTKREATYTNLDPGEYIFRVKASNNDLVWNETGRSIRITILPPWWKTWWFRTFVTLLVCGLSVGFYFYRLGRVIAQKRILEAKVEQRTQEIREKNEELMQQKEEIQTQAELLEASNHELEKLSLVASHTDNAVLIMNSEGILEWMNAAFTNLYEYSFEEYIQLKGDNLMADAYSKDLHLLIEKCKETKKSVIQETEAFTKSGKKLWVQTVLTPIVNAKGTIYKLVAIDSNFTAIKNAEKEISEQNEKIKGSIRYAKTIQQAILTFKDSFDEYFNSFIVFKPKDIVSGDFYWYAKIPATASEPERVYVAVVDCTGHGVPGAFMSLVGNRLISEIIFHRSIFSPKAILNELYREIRTVLRQDQTKNSDGMDLSLCMFQKRKGKLVLTYSGAKSFLYYFKSQTKSIEMLKSDRISIGGFTSRRSFEGFTEKEIELEVGDILYMMSDGIIDQNDETRSRFGTKRLEELLAKTVNLAFKDHATEIEAALASFQKTELQRDDITLIGLRVV